MPAPAAPNSDPTPAEDLPVATLAPDGEPAALPELPEEDFWESYNKRLEFPLSAVATVFLHVLVGAVLVYIIVGLMDSGEDRSNPELKLMQVGGLDDSGEGSAGSGGQNDPDRVADADPIKSLEKNLPTPQALADAKADIKKLVLEDPNGNLPIAPSNAAAFKDLDESLRKKLLDIGARQGDSGQPGKGYDDSKGSGVGGTGADSTRARGLRWVLRFSVRSGNDYISQLKSMGAEILIPLGDGKSIIVPDLGNPSSNHIATDADLGRLARKIQFSDNRKAMVNEVIDALGLKVSGQPKAFWAFFPKEVEEDLARKEKGYRNRRPEDIEETIYRVIIRGGSFETVVDDQVFKR
jgi:hypothetical protein